MTNPAPPAPTPQPPPQTLTIEVALSRAWALANMPEHDAFWRKTVWLLIFCVETAQQNGEVDQVAEGKLMRIAHLFWSA